jgi:hypothetical protein
MSASKIKHSVSGRELAKRKPLQIAADQALNAVHSLPAIGIHGFEDLVHGAMDSALVGPAMRSGATPAQFLQVWLPGIVRQLTTVRAIDRIAGITESGNWYDDTVVQQTALPVGKAELYGDSTNIPLANYQHGYETRGIVRYEQGFEVTSLAEAREAAGGINMAAEKRGAAIMSLEIARNRLGFYGFFNGTVRAFGLLNDPGLPAYVGAPQSYTTMTFEELTAEISAQLSTIMVNSGGNVDQNSAFTIVLPLGYSTIMSQPNTYGMTVAAWLSENYPNVRVEYSPELVGANGGANVAYYFADSIEDGSTDGGRALTQVVPAKFFNIGSERRAKGYIEDFGSATAGVMVLRPYLFVRRTGV